MKAKSLVEMLSESPCSDVQKTAAIEFSGILHITGILQPAGMLLHITKKY